MNALKRPPDSKQQHQSQTSSSSSSSGGSFGNMLAAMRELVDPKIGGAYRAFLLLDYRTLKEKRYTQANIDYSNFMKYRLPPNLTSSYDARSQSDTVGDFGAGGLAGMKAWPCICSVVSPEASKTFKDMALSQQLLWPSIVSSIMTDRHILDGFGAPIHFRDTVVRGNKELW
eukprot:CAMPEP_0185273104 /NCGR_PEP_ID=MMETSP1359-20130426/48765_1 /TAXON_ID=552665 /ORGANISM="Bigelowiella longifila, Strain CCMP242" /LENGTH=171 /DNA_ID=CAMNT_0027865605 /DNA_START=96 /DNA_END=608 /DNA_ORIENTATION=-